MDAEPPSPAGRASGYPPADFTRRFLARLCDLTLVALAFALLFLSGRPLPAALCAAALLLCGDRLFGPGRSLGKRMAGLRVVVLQTRQPCGITASMRRNLLFAAAVLPAAGGNSNSLFWAGITIVGVATIEAAVALAPLTTDLGRRRLGDLFAGTQVIDASIAIGLEALVPAAATPAAAAISATPRHAARVRRAPGSKPSRHTPEEIACASR